MGKIRPFLWFDNQAEEAMNFYLSVFKNAKAGSVNRVGGPSQNGEVALVTFELEGQEFQAINGGPHFTFSPAISFSVDCETQEEVDELWGKLSDGGEIMQCGWVTDKFGVTWQLVPTILIPMLHDQDPAKCQRVMTAMLQMKKLDIAALKKAYEG